MFIEVVLILLTKTARAETEDIPMLPPPVATPQPDAAAAPTQGQAPISVTVPIAKSSLISITKVVGEVGDHFVTSREVKINSAIEQALEKKPASLDNGYVIFTGSERSFPGEVTRVLDEWAVYFEARSLGSTQIQKAEIAKAVGVVEERWGGSQAWKDLEVGADELRQVIERKLGAKDFEKLKSDPALSPISDDEALAYYKKNRLRFGSLPFSNFQDNIKAFLVKTQVEKRLGEWHEVLRRKYKTRNFISG
jgi:hypothetical protein